MNNKIIIPVSNKSEGVEFFLRGAKKRRFMALTTVRQINTSIGTNLKVVSSK